MRVHERLEQLYEIGGGIGANRVAGTVGEDLAHEMASGWMREAGLSVEVDGRLTAGRAFEQVLALSHTVIFGQAALGLLLLAGQYRAPVQLHYVYGLAPAAAVLFAYSSRSEDPRRNTLVFSIIAVLAGLLAARAFMTGKGYG